MIFLKSFSWCLLYCKWKPLSGTTDNVACHSGERCSWVISLINFTTLNLEHFCFLWNSLLRPIHFLSSYDTFNSCSLVSGWCSLNEKSFESDCFFRKYKIWWSDYKLVFCMKRSGIRNLAFKVVSTHFSFLILSIYCLDRCPNDP